MRIINPRSEQLLDVGGHWASVWDGQWPFLCSGWSGGEDGGRVRFEEVIGACCAYTDTGIIIWSFNRAPYHDITQIKAIGKAFTEYKT
ncbi:hypothetical protein TNIN_23671 [Trichonephila inaurata madagascariensis]|uniref:Uncharacterized protein n=1 Tax=Trichonephila inaurata madagascariensis TaxID=2747483 RepID=A0A8X6YNR6_9ARAC|nr:hypothetical protein TNIN_23671 [Trichonephila inaurata madagascariensis]